MCFIWVARGLYSSMNTMFTFVYDKKKRSPAGQLLVCLCIHWKCFEETAQITILSELSYWTTIKFRVLFLAHLSRRLMGELIVYQSLRRPSVRLSVRQHFQTSSPLKPLGQLNSNFILILLRMRERKFVQMVVVTWPRWPPCPYMVKTL